MSIIIALLMCCTVSSAHSGEFRDWVEAATAVLLHHEAGHFNEGQKMTSAGFILTGRNGLNYSLEERVAPEKPAVGTYPGYYEVRRPDGVWQGVLPAAEFRRWEADMNQWRTAYNAWRNDVIRREGGVAGAGFVAQQHAIENNEMAVSMYKKGLMLSGLFQAGYVVYHYLDRGNSGDIARMSIAAPEQLIVGALLASAASDIARSIMEVPSKFKIGFLSDVRTGAVGLSFSGVF
jgi:hypothetical protein